MFLSTFEKPLDAKRRLLVPSDFRDAARKNHLDHEAFDGIYCFAGLEAPCLECGGPRFFDAYQAMIDALAFASAKRRALEHAIYGGMQKLNFDSGGRITLPETLSQRFELTDTAILVGLRDRFQIWEPKAYAAYEAVQAEAARAYFSGDDA